MGTYQEQSDPIGNLKWHFRTDDPVWSSPTVVGSEVYVGSDDGRVYAIDAFSGSKIWDYKTEGIVRSSPFVVDRTLYIGSGDGRIYALDVSSGNKEWCFKTEGAIRSSPTVENGSVYVGSEDCKIYALNAETGEKIWSFETGHEVWSSPVVVDESVIVGSKDDCIYAVDQSTGELSWSVQSDGRIESSPTVSEDAIYFCTYDTGTIFSIDPETGDINWRYRTNGRIRSCPTVAQRFVYITNYNGKLYAIHEKSGEVEWEFHTGNKIHSSPTVVDRVVYVADLGGRIHSIDALSGEKKWKTKINGKMSSSPTVANGILYIGNRNTCSLQAIHVKSGSSSGSRVLNKTLGHHSKDASHVGQGFVEESLSKGQQAIQEAEEANATGNYKNEVQALEEALTEFNNAWKIAKRSGKESDQSKIESQIKTVKKNITTAKKLKAQNEIEETIQSANEQITSGNELFKEEDYQSARESFEQAKQAFILALSKAKEHNIDQKSEIRDRIDKTTESVQNCTLASCSQRLSRGRQLINEDKFSEAKDSLEELVSEINSLDFETDEKRNILTKSELSLITAEVNLNREKIGQAQNKLNAGEYNDAHKMFENVKSSLEDLLNRAASMGVDQKQSEINELIELCSKQATEAREAMYEIVETNEDSSSTLDLKSPQTNVSVEQSGRPQSSSVTRNVNAENKIRHKKIPDFEELERLGEGGTASVYKVRLIDSGNIAALKLPEFRGTLNQSKFDEFVNEAETWTKVDDHNNIVSVIDWGFSDRPWLLMEYVEKGDVKSVMENIDVDDAIEIMDGICDALISARGVDHHDIKPENILLTQDLTPKLADWGLAKVAFRTCSFDDGLGSIGYRAPEQFQEQKLDDKTDMYQLGVTIYEILTGQLPFDPQASRSLEERIVNKQPTPPSEFNPEIPAKLDNIILRCLAKSKSDRFKTHTRLKDQLNTVTSSAP